MAEAEDVIIDVARHTTIYVRDLWLRHRTPPEIPYTFALIDVSARLDLFITSVFGKSYPIRIAQLPACPTFLSTVFKKIHKPYLKEVIPATNGQSIWLPPDSGITDEQIARELYRVMTLQQTIRAERGSPLFLHRINSDPLLTDIYLLLEAYAADNALVDLLPGMAGAINRLRQHALSKRPPLDRFAKSRQPLEIFLRRLLQSDCRQQVANVPVSESPAQSLIHAQTIAANLLTASGASVKNPLGIQPLLKDWWTGELRVPSGESSTEATASSTENHDDDDQTSTRSSRLERRPEVREALEDEDEDQEPGVWMVQVEDSHPNAEDPLGLQRPTDRDEDTKAEEYADLVSELAEARLVSTPGRPKEVLLSDDPPDARSQRELKAAIQEGRGFNYPEWDYRARVYHNPGATVRLLTPHKGSQQWVDKTLQTHKSLLDVIRRRFEMLRARRVLLRKQIDGDEIDLEAYTDSYADFRAGNPMADALYQTRRVKDRNIAITLLIDISGSTDSWISNNRRIIDVEREALLLVCIALESMGEAYSVQAFSGEGRHAVTLRQIKDFDENYSNDVALRIAALEPERYTRASAALRHASTQLMRMPAAHRLLLLLSDGKPNDNDGYEGRYGVEDMCKAVTEAKAQGVFPFCLTIDRQAANYLPGIFGHNQYALLPKPEQLPRVLLEWIKRLIVS